MLRAGLAQHARASKLGHPKLRLDKLLHKVTMPCMHTLLLKLDRAAVPAGDEYQLRQSACDLATWMRAARGQPETAP